MVATVVSSSEAPPVKYTEAGFSAGVGGALPGETMEQDDPPARKVVTRSPAKTVRILNLAGIFDAPIECESKLERDFVYQAALCPSVCGLRHQPVKLTLKSGRTYTPDFLATHTCGHRTIVEVKLGAKVAANKPLFDEAAAQLHARDIDFLVLTEKAIRRRNLHERAALILRYRKSVPDEAAVIRVVSALRNSGADGASATELLDTCNVSLECLFNMLTTRTVACSRDLFVEADSRLFLPQSIGEQDAVHIEGWFDAPLWRAHAGVDKDIQREGGSAPGCVHRKTGQPENHRIDEEDLD